MSMNNLSRNLFAEFLKKNPNMTRVDTRNVCDDDQGNRYAFTITDDNKIIQCRQFYEDCTRLLCYNVKSGKLSQVHKNFLILDKSPNRITVTGLKAYTAKCKREKAIRAFFNM